MADELFPLPPHAPAVRKIEFIECDFNPSSEEALDELKQHGLKRPTAEDALQFGIEHLEEQRKRPIVFLHEPVLGPSGRRFVLVLCEGAGGRYLSLIWFDFGWFRGYVFAGVRE